MRREVGLAKSMVVAGVMSGTSADGVDVAICRISPSRKEGGTPKVTVLGHVGIDYPKAVRAAVLAAMNAQATSVAEMTRLSWRLGGIYADAVAKAEKKFGVRVELVGCHGQTIYHQAVAANYLGERVRGTWQIGEASVIAERMRVPVVSDFRPADMAAGGQGAPLVPMLDYVMFRSEKVSRILQNVGGIANLTAVPAGASTDGVIAFDTGPGNMVIDGCMKQLFGRELDRGGAVARRGSVVRSVVDEVLRKVYFSAPPPKSCGREEFGEEFVRWFVMKCKEEGASDEDVVATATALTAESVLKAYREFVAAHLQKQAAKAKVEFVVAGGGAKNLALMGMLTKGFDPLGVRVRLMEELGVAAQAKEAVAFALLAWLTWFGLPGNMKRATGASREVVLGKVTRA
jgi:anhydro-N-acetylmuramic acid kinase